MTGTSFRTIATSRRGMLRWLGSASLTTLTSGLAPGLASAAKESPVYRDARAPVDLRVRDLMARMTLDEKVAQLITLSTTKETMA